MKPRSLFHTVVLLLVALAIGASTASAEKPFSEPVPAADITVVGACPFDVLLHPVQLNETFRLYSTGTWSITGLAKVEVTNLATEKSILVNASGPGQSRPTSDGGFVNTFEGHFMNWGFAPNPFLQVSSGLVRAVFAPDSTLTSVTVASNHVRDLCAELAA